MTEKLISFVLNMIKVPGVSKKKKLPGLTSETTTPSPLPGLNSDPPPRPAHPIKGYLVKHPPSVNDMLTPRHVRCLI